MKGERRMAKFSKKLLGRKIRTNMLMHRVVFKVYDNGITIKPWETQGVGTLCPKQEELFLTNECADYLFNQLLTFRQAKEITNVLNDKVKVEDEDCPIKCPFCNSKDYIDNDGGHTDYYCCSCGEVFNG